MLCDLLWGEGGEACPAAALVLALGGGVGVVDACTLLQDGGFDLVRLGALGEGHGAIYLDWTFRLVDLALLNQLLSVSLNFCFLLELEKRRFTCQAITAQDVSHLCSTGNVCMRVVARR